MFCQNDKKSDLKIVSLKLIVPKYIMCLRFAFHPLDFHIINYYEFTGIKKKAVNT